MIQVRIEALYKLKHFHSCFYTESVFVSVFVCLMDVDSPLHRIHLARSYGVRCKQSWKTRRHARLSGCSDVKPGVGDEQRLPKLAGSHKARRAERV